MHRLLRIGAVLMVLEMIICLSALVPVFAVSVPALAPATGGPGTTVTVSGTGTATENITINFDAILVGSTAVTAGGTWSTSIVIPQNVVSGPHPITAIGSLSGASAPANFTITPRITATQSTGNTILINGSGFASGEIVTVTIDGVAAGSSVQAGTNGSWGPVTASAASGNHTVAASGNLGSASTANVTVINNPTIALSKPNGTVGASITVTGNGFAINEAGITVNFDGVSVGQPTQANATGSWTTTFVVPPAASGTAHSITSVGATTTSVPAQTFSVTPNIAMNKNSGPAGTSVQVTGSGFASGETNVSVNFDGSVIGSPTTASAVGVWTATFTIPATQGGAHTVSASGSATSTAPTLTFTVGAGISLNKNTGPAGTSVNVTGSGFGSGETNIAVTFDGAPQGAPTTASTTGAWTASFTVPPSVGGAHAVAATGSTTTSVAAVNFTVGASISLNKTNGAAGTAVAVTGSGFAAGESNINVTFDGTPIGTPTQAAASGAWTATFTVPAAQGGTHTVGAFGSSTQAATVQTINFTMGAGIAINKASGTVGTTVTVTGSGFGANESGITVSYDGNPVGSPVNASPTGGWTSNITVPSSAAGQHTFGANSQQTPSAGSASFKVTPSIAFNTTSSYPGASVTVSGSGFAANSALQMTYDSNPITTNTALAADASGNFSKSITIPKSLAGPHSIKVVDAQGNSGDSSFSISSTPPPVPNPVSPSDGQKVGLFGGAAPTFRWSAVSDQTNVTYRLQVDTESDFPHPILDVQDIASNHYTLSQSQALDAGQYYWRVQAVDAASNVGPWSQPVALQSGTIAVGLFVLLIIVILAAIAIVLFIVVIRPRRKKLAPAPARAAATGPEITMPEVVDAEYRTIEPEDTGKKRALPWRLALPQAPQEPKGGKTLSNEDRARLKVIIDFAKSLPLIESGNNTNWLIELAENGSGAPASPTLYAQLLRGEMQVKYEPAWMKHPIFMDLQILLEGQPILDDLNAFIDSVNNAASKDLQILQEIYRDAIAEYTGDILDNDGWKYISGIYTDALSWYLGKSLREPSERDYSTKLEGNNAEGTGAWGLYGEANTSFAGLLVRAPEEKEALQLRALHLKLRRAYRNNDKAREVASITTQLDVKRSKLLADFSQFNRLNP